MSWISLKGFVLLRLTHPPAYHVLRFVFLTDRGESKGERYERGICSPRNSGRVYEPERHETEVIVASIVCDCLWYLVWDRQSQARIPSSGYLAGRSTNRDDRLPSISRCARGAPRTPFSSRTSA